MKYLRYIWQSFTGIITICVLLSAYTFIESSNQPQVFSLIFSAIMLCIVNISSYARSTGLLYIKSETNSYLHFRQIKQALNLPVEDDQEIENDMAVVKETESKGTVPMIVEFIMWVIILFNIYKILG